MDGVFSSLGVNASVVIVRSDPSVMKRALVMSVEVNCLVTAVVLCRIVTVFDVKAAVSDSA